MRELPKYKNPIITNENKDELYHILACSFI